MFPRYRNKKNQRRGASAVEFAVVAPVFFFLTWAAFELMRVSMIQSAVDVATYEAARAVMVPGSKISEAEAEADKYLNYLGGRSKTLTVQAFDQNGDVQTEINDFTSRVQVDIEVPIRSSVMLLSRFFGNRTITSSTSLTFESYSGFYDGSSY